MIYLDHSATTPVDNDVVKAMRPYFFKKFGNPSSKHQLGQEAEKAVNASRSKLADFFGIENSNGVIFTAGGSQANNLALKGLTQEISSKVEKDGKPPHLITSQIEHSSVFETAQSIEKNTKWEVSYLKPNKDGVITAESLRKKINDNTRVVSVILADNETGIIQPISQMGEIIDQINQKRDSSKKIYFHTDAVQAIEYLDCRLDKLNVDLLSLSAHKFYGPKGIGALITKSRPPLSPLITGGGQESGLIAGTENVPGIIGLKKAIELVDKRGEQLNKQIETIRNYFESELKDKLNNIVINGENTSRLSGSSNILFPDAEGESILLSLDMEGIATSTGSACASKNLKPSRTILAMGISPEKAQSAIRFSFGKDNSKKEVDHVVKKLVKIINKLRKISPET